MHAARTALLALAALAVSACGPDPHAGLGLVVDPCAPVLVEVVEGASAERRASAARAAQMWNDAAGTALVLADSDEAAALGADVLATAPRIPVRFREAAWAFHGQYDDVTGEVFVNDAIEDDRSRTVVLAHELGHAMALTHVDDREGVMKSGNMELPVNEHDVADLHAVWGACAP